MPDTMVDTETIKDAVILACRAPSLHNSQPWRWVLEGNSLRLFVHPDRVVRRTDRSGREALISCGVILDHLRAALAAAGWKADVNRFPNPNNPLHIASIHVRPIEFVTDKHLRRADAILVRRTDRLPFASPPDWESFESGLRRVVNSDAVRLDVIADELRPHLAQASQLTEALRLYDASYHTELQWWTAAFELAHGIPHSSLVSAAESDRVDVGRAFPVTQHRERRADVDEDHSRIVVLSTYDESPYSVVRCGEALSALLLDATMAGLATCTLSHITELPASRAVVTELIGRHAVPQVLIRVGLAPAMEDVPPPTPRRPIQDVFIDWPATGLPGDNDSRTAKPT